MKQETDLATKAVSHLRQCAYNHKNPSTSGMLVFLCYYDRKKYWRETSGVTDFFWLLLVSEAMFAGLLHLAKTSWW